MTEIIEIDVVGHKVRVEIEREQTGRITSAHPLNGDPLRRGMIDTVDRLLKAGKTIEETALNQLGFHAVLNEMRRAELRR